MADIWDSNFPHHKHDDSDPEDQGHAEVLEIFVRMPNGDKKKWISRGLSLGSSIEVEYSDESQRWVWERKMSDDGFPLWAIRPIKNRNLYLTYDDTDDVTMQLLSDKSYFCIVKSIGDGFFIKVPGNQNKHLSLFGGKLVLSENIHTEWLIQFTLFKFNQLTPNVRSNVYFIRDMTSTSHKWVWEESSNHHIRLDRALQGSENVKWVWNSAAEGRATYLRPKLNLYEYVTCRKSTNSVVLQKARDGKTTEDMLIRPVAETEQDGFKLANWDGERYLREDPVTNLLVLHHEKRLANVWEFQFLESISTPPA